MAINILLLLCSGYFSAITVANDKQPNDFIALNFHQAPTSVILQSLADMQQMNLILAVTNEHIQTVKLHNVSWHKALAIVIRGAKWQYQIEDNLLIISEQPDPQSLLLEKQQQRKEQEMNLPLIYWSLPVNHQDIKSLLAIIREQALLSERGKVFIDERSNLLVVNDIAKNIDKIKQLVILLDKLLPQIHIAAHIVTMSDESSTELGIKWGYAGSSSQFINQFDVNLSSASASSVIGFNLAKRASNLLNLQLAALEAENQLEIIASPNLITSHKNTASIKQGTEIPYEVSSGNNGKTSVEFKQAVLGLEVTPRILSDDLMELTLYITQNTAGRSIKRSDGGEALAIDTQEIRTQVFVKSGETLVLGGIFQQSHQQEARAVPGLSQLPILGNLFKAKGNKQQKRELVIFITPQLIPF